MAKNPQAAAAEISALEKALNKNDQLDMSRMDDLVCRAERLETLKLPDKHEHDSTVLDKMVDFQKRLSREMQFDKK